jgi:hypothetical protein
MTPQDIEEKRRRAAIAQDRATMPFDFGVSPVVASSPEPPSRPSSPVWETYWRQEGIRYLGNDLPKLPDAMERFRHAFELGYLACRRIEKR